MVIRSPMPRGCHGLDSVSRLRAAVWLAALACSSCSFVFVERPPPARHMASPRPGACTSSKLAPVADTILAGWQVVRIGVAASAHDSVYRQGPISREADVALGVAYAGLFAASAVYGYTATTTCAELKEREHDEGDGFMKRPSREPRLARTPIRDGRVTGAQ